MRVIYLGLILGLIVSCGEKTTERVNVINTKTYVKTLRCGTSTNNFKECLVDDYAVVTSATVLQNYGDSKCEQDVNFFIHGARIDVSRKCDALFQVEFIVR